MDSNINLIEIGTDDPNDMPSDDALYEIFASDDFANGSSGIPALQRRVVTLITCNLYPAMPMQFMMTMTRS